MSDENSRCPYCNADLGEFGSFMANWSTCNKCDRSWSEIPGKNISQFYFDKCPKCGSTSLQVGCSGARLCNDCQFLWTPGEEENGTYGTGGGKSCGGCCGGGCCGKSSEGESRDNSSENESASTPKCQSCGKDNPLNSWPPDKRAAYTPDKCYDCSSKKCKGNGACSGYNKCKKKGRDCQAKCAKAKSAAASGCFSLLSDLHIKLIEPALQACCAHCGVSYSPPE